LLRQHEAALGDRADPAPAAISDGEDAPDGNLGIRVAGPSHRTHVLVLHGGPARFELPDGHQDALEQVERFEAGDDDRHSIPPRDRFVLGPAHDGTDVGGGKESLPLTAARGEDRGDRGWDEYMADEDAEVASIGRE